MISPATSRLVDSRAAQSRARVCSALLLTLTALCALSPESRAQNADDANRRRKGGEEGGGGRGNMSPQDMQARMTNMLRERLDVPDDEEWKIISERLMAVMQLRRSSGSPSMFGGGFPGRGGGPSGGGGDRGGGGGGDSSRGGRSGRGGMTGGNSETAALSSAVRDKLPEAEIKARLDRVRQVRKENEVKLTKAQEELRAVLSIRQEAVAVVFGLLP